VSWASLAVNTILELTDTATDRPITAVSGGRGARAESGLSSGARCAGVLGSFGVVLADIAPAINNAKIISDSVRG
jgi:hypothetical protein